MSNIESLIIELASDPFNPEISFKIALEYEAIGQTASAIYFYLRTAEYGYDTHPEYVYTSLLKSSQCFSKQKFREVTVNNLILKAIAYIPIRPEAWFQLSLDAEKKSKWQECYTYAEVGLGFANQRLKSLPSYHDYPGDYVLNFQKAVAAWWVGRKDECFDIFKSLENKDIEEKYMSSVRKNLELFS